MIDFRHETFLTLCNIGSYTKTATVLHISQPAVSQHIKFLEEQYECKLFYYEGKTLKLTQSGTRLKAFMTLISADYTHFKQTLLQPLYKPQTITFGATLSIGEYVMPDILTRLMEQTPNINLHMQVENTQALLNKLDEGDISFAFIEGFFDKSNYGWKLFSKEAFIAVCCPTSPLANATVSLRELFQQRLIIREVGSGTRTILEQLLHAQNCSINSFQQVCEVGNMNAIKKLVEHDLGITFLYQVAAQEALQKGTLAQIKLKDFQVSRAFYFLYLKHSHHELEYLSWYQNFLNIKRNEKSV